MKEELFYFSTVQIFHWTIIPKVYLYNLCTRFRIQNKIKYMQNDIKFDL